MFFDPIFSTILQDALPWAGMFFMLITELGSDIFYIALLLTGYWSFRKRESIDTLFVLLVAVVSNYWLKLAIHNPRPEGVLYSGYEMADNYSTPSGHAQNSATLFGWLGVKVRTWWMLLISVVLTALIGISRIYLGVHYLGDVLLGWGIGIVTVLAMVYLEKPLKGWLAKYSSAHLYEFLFMLALGLTVIATYLAPLPPGDDFGALGGLMMGIAVGFPLEAKYVQFTTDGSKARLIIRDIVGLVLVIGVLYGLDIVFPTIDPIIDVWLRAIRYFMVAVVGAFLWPAIFRKIGL